MPSYITCVLAIYTALPDTPDRPRPQDRALARDLLHRQVPLSLVGAAIQLGASRRQSTTHPLPPIRSLHYFLPILEELQAANIDPQYLAYLKRRNRATPDG